MGRKGIKKHLLSAGIVIGIGLAGLGGIAIPALIISNEWKKDIKNFGEKANVMERSIMYNIADRNYDKKLDSSETYQLGLELGIIKDNEKIPYEDLAKKIENVSIKQVENYITRWNNKQNSKKIN